MPYVPVGIKETKKKKKMHAKKVIRPLQTLFNRCGPSAFMDLAKPFTI